MSAPAPEFQCSVIVPVFNAAQYLGECIESVLAQTDFPLRETELILFDDGSSDGSLAVAAGYRARASAALGRYLVLHAGGAPSGAGSARNRCCEAARGALLVFLDADDVMHAGRLARTAAVFAGDARADVAGGAFDRIPAGATPRYTRFHARVTDADLHSRVFAFRDNPLAMPTLACRRALWVAVGGFREGRGVPEDAHFLYDAMALGCRMRRIPPPSLTGYRFHDGMVSHSYSRQLLMRIRVEAFERTVLARAPWVDGFSVWGAGRDGKEFYKLLSPAAQGKVVQWGDIDPRKIGQTLRGCPIVHFSKLKSPIALCVAMDRGGEFEANLKTLGLQGGKDYFHLV